MAADGSAIASWSQDDGNGYDVWVNRYAAGAWGTPRLLRQEPTPARPTRAAWP